MMSMFFVWSDSRLAEHLISSNNQQMKFSIDVNHEVSTDYGC